MGAEEPARCDELDALLDDGVVAALAIPVRVPNPTPAVRPPSKTRFAARENGALGAYFMSHVLRRPDENNGILG